MIAWLGSKLLWVGGLALAILTAVATVWSRGRDAGSTAEKLKQQDARDALQKHYDEIDRSSRDFDGALGRLRDRAGPGDRG